MPTCCKVLPFELDLQALATVCEITDEQQTRFKELQAKRIANRRARARAFYWNNYSKCREYARRLYSRNSEQIKAKNNAYYYRVKDTPEYKARQRAYYLEHKEQILAKCWEYCQNHIEQVRAIKLRSYHKRRRENYDEMRARERAYEQAHREHITELQRLRRAKMTAEQRAEYNRKQNEVHRQRREQYNKARREKRRQAREQAKQNATQNNI